jgi:hypothetical protein
MYPSQEVMPPTTQRMRVVEFSPLPEAWTPLKGATPLAGARTRTRQWSTSVEFSPLPEAWTPLMGAGTTLEAEVGIHLPPLHLQLLD